MNFFKQLPLYFAITLLAFISIGAEKVYKPDFTFRHKFAYTVDGAGIYFFDLQTHIDRKIFKTARPFLANSLVNLNDSEISISVRTVVQEFNLDKILREDTDPKYIIENNKKTEVTVFGAYADKNVDTAVISKYIDSTYTVNIYKGSYYVTKTKETIIRFSSSTVITTLYNPLGITKDTTVETKPTQTEEKETNKYTFINTVDDKKVYVYDRKIYMVENKDTSRLVKIKYDFVFFDGMNLSKDAKKIIYSYREMSIKIKYRLCEYDIETKKSQLIAKEFFENLQYTTDHKLVLMRNYHKQHTDRKPLYSIFVLDPSTKQKRNLCTGNDYVWIE